MYETRITAFVDLLGFRDLVEKSRRDASLVPQLVLALEAIYDGYPAWRTSPPPPEVPPEYVDDRKSLIRSHTFSDSILVSSETTVAGIYAVVKGVCFTITRLLGMGQLARGGIALGDLYHDERIVFGPALVEAYDLEHKTANCPRILLSEEFIALAREYEEVTPYFRRDSDGLFFLDVLSWQIDSDPQDHGWLPLARRWMESLRSDTEARIHSKEDERVHDKNVWFARYFNEVVRQHSELGVSTIEIV